MVNQSCHQTCRWRAIPSFVTQVSVIFLSQLSKMNSQMSRIKFKTIQIWRIYRHIETPSIEWRCPQFFSVPFLRCFPLLYLCRAAALAVCNRLLSNLQDSLVIYTNPMCSSNCVHLFCSFLIFCIRYSRISTTAIRHKLCHMIAMYLKIFYKLYLAGVQPTNIQCYNIQHPSKTQSRNAMLPDEWCCKSNSAE